jgi:hypothetical protein
MPRSEAAAFDRRRQPLGPRYAIVFSLETSFHRLARRPGGLPRHQALRDAKTGALRLFINCFRPAAPLHAPAMRPAPRSGYLAMASGFKLD